LSFNYRTGNELDNKAIATPVDLIDHKQWETFAKWSYTFDHGGRLRAILDRYEREVDSDLKSVLGFGRQYRSTVSLIGNDTQERNRASLDYLIRDLAGFDLASLMIYYQGNESEQATIDTRADLTTSVPNQLIERLFSFRDDSSGLEAKVRRDFTTQSAEHILVGGIEWNHSRLTEARDGLATNLVTGATTKVLPPGETLPQRDLPRSDVDSVGVYLQDEIQFGALTLIPAIRWDRFKLDASTDGLFTDASRLTDLEDNNLSFRLGMTRRMSDHLTLFLHYAEGFRAPPAEDVNLFLDYRGFINLRALPNPDLKAEQSKNYETGVRFNYEGTNVSLGGYHSIFDNFIESRVNIGVDPSDGTLLFQSRNIQNARIYGFEAEISQQLSALHPALDAWSLDAGYHWAKGENRDTNLPINLVNPAKAVFGLHWQESGTTSASLRVRHYSRQTRVDFSEGDFFVAPSQAVIDLTARWRLRPSIEIVAGLYNLNDSRYWRYGDVRMFDPIDPRVESLTRPGRNAAVTFYYRQ
ncbi:MAG: TonB-dependent receptor, partial [Pseudomonadales bacterium]